MDKLFFVPVSIISGLIAGQVGKRLFGLIWRLIDDQEPPQARHRDVNRVKLASALVIQGALFALIRGLLDHGARHVYARLTGAWPGEEEPEGT
jgi:hypothetical protein